MNMNVYIFYSNRQYTYMCMYVHKVHCMNVYMYMCLHDIYLDAVLDLWESQQFSKCVHFEGQRKVEVLLEQSREVGVRVVTLIPT